MFPNYGIDIQHLKKKRKYENPKNKNVESKAFQTNNPSLANDLMFLKFHKDLVHNILSFFKQRSDETIFGDK